MWMVGGLNLKTEHYKNQGIQIDTFKDHIQGQKYINDFHLKDLFGHVS